MDLKLYTEKYEYVREMIQTFIDGEIQVYEKKLDSLYDDGSWHVGFFELNLNQLAYNQVETQLDRLMNIGGTEQVQYNTALARVQSLFVNISMAVGEECLNLLEENCVVGLMHMRDPDRNRRKNVYKTFRRLVSKYPILIVSAMGSAYFQAKHIQFTHRPGHGSQK